MIDSLAALCLLSGAFVSLLAAIGVVRLPDVFMRMHSATKSGVVGCGLILIAVALIDGGVGTAVKVAVATVFLLLTTPVAGHLLGRAAYVSGAPFWRGMVDDQLRAVLPRRHFGPSRLSNSPSLTSPTEVPAVKRLSRVVLALAQGPHLDAAIEQAIALARQHDAELCGVSIIDEPRLFNVGPIPIGGGHHAAELRKWRLAKARQAAADVIELFEARARDAGVQYMVRLDEGRPHAVLRALRQPGHVLAIAPGGWFDQGVLEQSTNTMRRLVRNGVYPILALGVAPVDVDRLRFVHDGSARSWAMLRMLLEIDLWPEAKLVIGGAAGTDPITIEQAVQEARGRGRRAEQAADSQHSREYLVIGNAESQGWLPRWFGWRRSSFDAKVVAAG